MKEIKVENVMDEYMAENLVDFLKNEGIPAYYTPAHDGGVTAVYTGHPLTGYDIIIRQEDEIKAKEALKFFE